MTGIENLFAASWVNAAPELQKYLVDAFQRTVLFLDLLRRRGNQEKEIQSQSMATVLHFDHELLICGRSLPKPINFSLSRIVPPNGVLIDRHKRPVMSFERTMLIYRRGHSPEEAANY